jgi:drug/metabolite transporter (DMT)-like permease
VLLALLAALSFSTLAVWGRLAENAGLTTPTLLAWRFAIAGLVLFALGLARDRVTLGQRLVMLGFGLYYTVQTTMFFATLGRISAGTSALLLYLAPAFVVLYAWLAGQRPRGVHLAAVGLTLAGLAVVVGLPGERDRDALGLLLGTLTGAAYGAYLLGSERFLVGLRPLNVAAHVCVGAAVGFVVLGMAGGSLGVPAGAAQWGVVAASVVIPTLVALPALFGAVARLGAARASIVATTEPVWTVVLAALLLGEAARAGQLLGGALILAGAVLAQWRSRMA